MHLTLTLGEKVKDLRKEKKLTLKELSEAIEKKTGVNIAPSTLSDLEKYGDSKSKDPRLSTLKAIAQFFGVSIDYLAGYTEAKSPQTEMQAIHRFLGLSETSINLLKMDHSRNNKIVSTINTMLEAEDGELLRTISDYMTFYSKDIYIKSDGSTESMTARAGRIFATASEQSVEPITEINGDKLADIYLLQIQYQLQDLRKKKTEMLKNGKH